MYIYVSPSCFTIEQLFSQKNMTESFYIDEWISKLKINHCGPSIERPKFVNQKQWNLIQITQSLPIRILNDKGLLSLMQPGFRRNEEPLRFRANLIAINTEDLIYKINSMKNWFLRSKVKFRLTGKKEEFIFVDFSSSKEFYLNQFHSDFKEFSTHLFGPPQYCLKASVSDWLALQRDLIYENHTGFLPDPYTKFNSNFSRFSRVAPGSNLQPLIHSEGPPRPSHTH